MQAAGALRNVVCLSGGMTMLAVLAVTSVHAEPIGSGGSRAPLELTTRGMLLQRWDRNRDGKIDIGEAEMARTQMRRERIERAERSRIDPITGRRADDLFSADDEDDGDLFGRQRPSRQMPGLPGPAATTADAAAGSRAAADAEAAPDPSKAPTVTLFGPPPGLPPAAGASGAGAAPLSSAARVLPQASGRSTLGGVNPSVPVGGSRPFERPTAPLGGAITGGVRAGAPAVRPGYGTTGTPNDLNAGLRGGSPADFRGVTQPGTSGGSMFRGFVPRGSSSLNAGRPATTQRPPTTPRPGSTPTDFYGP